jgi:hypothetical protein
VATAEQRIFFMGRELKNSHRTLSNIGIGNFGIYVLHLHLKKNQSVINKVASADGPTMQRKRDDADRKQTKTCDVIELLDSSPHQTPSVVSGRRKRQVTSSLLSSGSSSRNGSSTVAAAMDTIILLDDEEEAKGPSLSNRRRVKAKSSGEAPIDLSES